VNVLVHAHRREAEHHERVRRWVRARQDAAEPFAVPDLVLSGFLRLVTFARIYARPSTIGDALEFADAIRASPSHLRLAPGARHWSIFTDLCRATNATGNRVPDAYLAAMAIESGSTWVTFDRGFGRYPGLRWRTPLEEL